MGGQGEHGIFGRDPTFSKASQKGGDTFFTTGRNMDLGLAEFGHGAPMGVGVDGTCEGNLTWGGSFD